jgi:hypothetical protein
VRIPRTQFGMCGKPGSKPAKSSTYTGPAARAEWPPICAVRSGTPNGRGNRQRERRSGSPVLWDQADPGRPPVSVHRGTMGSQTGNERRGVTEDVWLG